MKDYTKSEEWDIIWSKPYSNYEKHHQLFWKLIREKAEGKILDIGCGSASCWKNLKVNLHGIDFSWWAIKEAVKNCPNGEFIQDRFPTNFYDGRGFDTIVLCGIINYYADLKPLLEMVKRAMRMNGKVLVTINVIDDFPDRHWDFKRVLDEFSCLGYVRPEFYDKIGWFIGINDN